MIQAACSVISRAACICAAESAIQFCTDWCSPRIRPWQAVGRTLAEHVERAARHAEEAHAVVDAPGSKPLLRDLEPLPFVS